MSLGNVAGSGRKEVETALDLVGPQFFFGGMMGATVHLVTTEPDLTPVKSDLGLAIVPTSAVGWWPIFV